MSPRYVDAYRIERERERRGSGGLNPHCCVEGVRRAQHTYEARARLLVSRAGSESERVSSLKTDEL